MMIEFIVTVNGCIFHKVHAEHSCDAIIAARDRYPNARSLSVRVA